MKSLFNRYEAYNTNGRKVSDEIQVALDPIFEKWAKEGYKANDIESIAMDNVTMIGCLIRMERAPEMVNRENEKRSNDKERID